MNSTEPKSPCKDCPDRMLSCHDYCEAFQEYRNKKQIIEKNRKQYLDSIRHTKACREKNPKFKRLRGK